MGCLNQNQSVPAQFYYANIQRITFHVPSDHTIYGAAPSAASPTLVCTMSPSLCWGWCIMQDVLHPMRETGLHAHSQLMLAIWLGQESWARMRFAKTVHFQLQ